MRQDLCVLIVGLGSIGRRHLASLRKLGVTDVIACRSGDGPGTPDDVRSVSNFDAAFAAHPDCAIIANPTSEHLPAALACAAAGCDLFIERPVADGLAGLEELEFEVQRRQLVTFVGYNLRFDPVVVAARDALRSGTIGKVLSARLWVGQYLPDWYPGRDYRAMYVARGELGGGMLLTLSHEIDYAFWLLGGAKNVVAVLSQPSALEMNADSLAEVIMLMDGGALCSVHLDGLRRTASRGFDIVGENGSLCGDLVRRTLHLELPGSAGGAALPLPTVPDVYEEEMSHFLSCVRSRKVTRNPLSEGVAVMRILAAAKRSAACGEVQPCR